MDSLPLKDQKDLRELLVLYDSLTLKIERDGLHKCNAQQLHDVYDAMSKLLGEVWSKMPEVNN